MALRLLLLDMDDVVYAYDRSRRIAVIARETGVDPAVVEARIWGSGWQDQVDETAGLTADAYLEGWQARLGVPVSRELWVRARRAGMTTIAGTLALARIAAGRVPVGVLTNNGPLLFEARHDLVPDLAALAGDRFLVSASFDCRKPDPRVFRRAADRLDLSPAEILFVDDKPENAEGAIAAGCAAHRFRTVADLGRALVRAGLVDPADAAPPPGSGDP